MHPVNWRGKPRLKAGSVIPARDWRLDNLTKARWWAKMDMEEEAREHPDWNHVAVERLAEDVCYLQDVHDTADIEYVEQSPYWDILAWMNRKFEFDLGP